MTQTFDDELEPEQFGEPNVATEDDDDHKEIGDDEATGGDTDLIQKDD